MCRHGPVARHRSDIRQPTNTAPWIAVGSNEPATLPRCGSGEATARTIQAQTAAAPRVAPRSRARAAAKRATFTTEIPCSSAAVTFFPAKAVLDPLDTRRLTAPDGSRQTGCHWRLRVGRDRAFAVNQAPAALRRRHPPPLLGRNRAKTAEIFVEAPYCSFELQDPAEQAMAAKVGALGNNLRKCRKCGKW